jgi:hypothetical protein
MESGNHDFSDPVFLEFIETADDILNGIRTIKQSYLNQFFEKVESEIDSIL